MRKLLGLGWLWAGLLWSSSLRADQYSDMVQGLRERQYFDYALLYLDQLAAKTDVPADVRQMIPYEKALVLLDSSKVERLPERQLAVLDQAQAFLEEFARESPSHPKAGDANSQRAEILLGKARVEIIQSRAPTNQETRGDFQNKARALIGQARQVFATAEQQHEANWQSFGTFVNPDEKERYEAREQALMQLISAMLNVCLCRYEEAQTHDAGTPEHKKVLNEAALEFEKLHQRYRNYTGGLYARLYEGKCFDDQGDTQKAMGIYNELLDHDGSNPNLRKLQSKTLQFKLEALNRKSPPDSQVVFDLAETWKKENPSEKRTQTGMAIQWEQTVALEGLGDQRELPKQDKERFWRNARTSAQQINKFRSIYSDVSLAMIQRLDGKLGGRERKPDTFEAAQGLANQHFKAIQDLRKALEPINRQGKTDEEIKKLEQEMQTESHDAAEMFQLALNLADKNDDPKAVALARLWYAYVHFWARRSYEAAILAEFVSKTAPKDDVSSLAIDAAYLAMAAFVQAYNDTKGPPDTKTADLGFVIRACEFIIKRWPESDRANDARLMAGRMYSLAKKPQEAAGWFSQVPEADKRFPEAQMSAGQAFWDAYRLAARMPADQRPPADKLQQYQATAQQHLRTGIGKLTASLPKESPPPPELADAKVSLSAMLINQGQESEAITVLTADPQSVVKAVTVPDEGARPQDGVQKRIFAVDVYKLLLRAYVGSSQLDEARATMKTLETVAAGGNAGADVTELYVDLGKKLKGELDEYRAAGQTDRAAALRTSFETFLNDIYQRKEGHSFGTLSWIGETYSALGESDADNASSALSYFEKATSALQEILRLAEGNPSFATTDQLLAAKTRLIHALRMKKDFPEAEKLATELLKQKKDDLRLQLETAKLYQDWAAEPGEEKKYKLAIGGNVDIQALGYGPLSKRLHGNLKRNKQPELLETYFDTRYQTSACRLQYALAQKSSKAKREMLDNTDIEILNFAKATREVPDDVRARFNTLFKEVRTAIADPKRPVQDLEFTADLMIDAKPEVADEPKKKPTEPKKEKLEKAPEVASPLMTYGLLGGGVVAGLAIVAFMMFGKKKKAPLLHTQDSATLGFDFADVPAPPKQKPLVAVGPAREKKTASATPAAKSSSAAPTATKAPAKPRPKPRPEA